METLRSDAVARRELILDSANAVFSEHGITAALDLVIERAGVGRATLYRNFANRACLMHALMARSLQALEDTAQQYADRDDALFLLFERIARNIAASASLVDFWRAMDRDNDQMEAARKRVGDIFKEPLQRAIHAGLCRPDLQLSDIPLISCVLGASLPGKTLAERQALSLRTLELLLDGLRPCALGKK